MIVSICKDPETGWWNVCIDDRAYTSCELRREAAWAAERLHTTHAGRAKPRTVNEKVELARDADRAAWEARLWCTFDRTGEESVGDIDLLTADGSFRAPSLVARDGLAITPSLALADRWQITHIGTGRSAGRAMRLPEARRVFAQLAGRNYSTLPGSWRLEDSTLLLKLTAPK